jgi:protein gp37
MGTQTKIQCCHHTFNPWIGCTKVSEGCAKCYAEHSTRARVLRHQGHETWGKSAVRSRTSEANWKEPLKWNAAARKSRVFEGEVWKQWGESSTVGQPESRRIKATREQDDTIRGTREFTPEAWAALPAFRPRVFCSSLADWLDDEVPIEWFTELLGLIQDTPHFDWLLLTKRPQNFKRRMNASLKRILKATGGEPCNEADFIDGWVNKCDTIPNNVWIGCTAENQKRFDERYSHLSEIPAKVRFWSMEPLLDGIDFTALHDSRTFKHYFHWVITGGESGHGARHCHTDDLRDIVSQCELAEVPCFVKQLGSQAVAAGRDQKKLIAMKHKKGGDPDEWPVDLRVREYPKLEAVKA